MNENIFPKLFTVTIVLLLAANSAYAQSVQLDPVLDQRSHEFVSYPGEDNESVWSISLNEDGLFLSQSPDLEFQNVLDYDLSPDLRHLAVLRQAGDDPAQPVWRVEIYNADGVLAGLYSDLGELDPSDPSLKLYLLGGGNLVIRDNIVGFSIYDQSEQFIDRVSNSSGSPDGETMSRLVSSPDGSQIYVYNPRILSGENFSSRIGKLELMGNIRTLYTEQGSEILNITATDDGEAIFVVFRDQAGSYELRRINQQGEVTAVHRPDMESPNFYVQPELGTVTWFEQNHAQVYDVASGERLANAYFRQQNIVFAMYEPRDNIVLTITGSRNNRDGIIQANGVRVVDLDARVLIHSDDISNEFRFQPESEPRMVRTAANTYLLLNGTNALQVRVNR